MNIERFSANRPQAIISEFIKLGNVISVLNGNAHQPIKIILEIRGIEDKDEDPILNTLYAKKYGEWFAKWSHEFHRYKIPDEDKNKLLKLAKEYTGPLSDKTRALFKKFGHDYRLWGYGSKSNVQSL